MEQKSRISPDSKDKSAELPLSPISFQAGGVYLTRDEKISFPTRKRVKEPTKPRMVVVLGTEGDLNDLDLPHVSVVPITTAFHLESTQDLPVSAGAGNLNKDSLLKAGLIQPILKSDFEVKIGQLQKKEFTQLKATVFMNLGLGEGEDEEIDHDKETMNNDYKD